MRGSEPVRVVLAEDEHLPELAAFYREVWEPGASADGSRRARDVAAATNLVEPGVAPPVFLALRGRRVIGHLGSIPARFWDGLAELPGYWLKGLVVLPEFRGGPIGFSLVREAARRLPRAAAMVVTTPARRLFTAVGFTDLGALPNYVRVLQGSRVAMRLDIAALGLEGIPASAQKLLRLVQRTGLAALGGGLAGAALRLRAGIARLGASGFADGTEGLPGIPELDELWNRGRYSVRAAAVRDGAEFHFRYGRPAGTEAERYRVVSVTRGASLAGVAAIRVPRAEGDARLKGIAVASLSDIWFDPADATAGLETLGAVETAARRLGADAILVSSGHQELARVFSRQGYVRAGSNVHLLFRDSSPGVPGAPPPLDEWWTCRGDARSDEVF